MKTTKTKLPQPKNDMSGRNNFLTPRYATELLIPYIPSFITNIWECAAGSRRMSKIFEKYGYNVLSSDLPDVAQMNDDVVAQDFINDLKRTDVSNGKWVIASNPPFSLKFDFINTALEYDIPFAFLIPFDMCSYLHKQFRNGLQAIVPERRIDYLTPNIVERINVGEGICAVNKIFGTKHKKFEDLEEVQKPCFYEHMRNFKHLDDGIPYELLKKYSSSDFHSFWITYKFDLPSQFVFAPLSLSDKRNIL